MAHVHIDDANKKVYKIVEGVLQSCTLINRIGLEWDSENYEDVDMSVDGMDIIKMNIELNS